MSYSENAKAFISNIESFDNIEIISSVLILLSIVLFIIIIISIKKNPTKKRKKYIKNKNKKQNTSAESFNELIQEDNNLSPTVDLQEEEKKDISDSGPAVDLKPLKDLINKKDTEVTTFKFSPIALIKAQITDTWYIYNPVIKSEEDKIVSKKDFFHNIQKKIVEISQNNTYAVTKEEIISISKKIWTGSFKKILMELERVNESHNFLKNNPDISEQMLRKIIVEVLENKWYQIYWKKIQEETDSFHENVLKVLNKKKNNIELTTQEEKNYLDFKWQRIINEELTKIAKGTSITLINFDIDSKILKLKISYKDIFNKKIYNVINFYKKKGKLEDIIFYL